MPRPRGFIHNWIPKDHVQTLIDQVDDIITESTILPLTLRQIFYMLVSNHDYPKDERAYKRLCETMNRARRAKMIDMDAIRDDGLTRRHAAGWASRRSFLRNVQASAKYFTLDRQTDQKTKLYVWCEAGGMVPQLYDAVSSWHIPVLSSGGFDSVTTKHNLAQELGLKEHVVVLHLGDHDPSGVHMYGSLDEDLQAFMYEIREADGWGNDTNICDIKRIAVTPDQVDEMGLPTAPPKKTDKREFYGLTTQCEAIAPPDLRDIVQAACLEYIDEDILQQTKDREDEIAEELVKKFGDLI